MREEPESTIDEKSEFPSEGDGTRAWAERWLSPERFEPYLAACDGDAGRALDLYEWNAALGAGGHRVRSATSRSRCETPTTV